MTHIRAELAKAIPDMMHNIDRIRNIGIVAHIHHGKTTLSDNLLAAAGMISNELAGKQLYLNFDEQEQARLLTINNADVTIVHEFQESSISSTSSTPPGTSTSAGTSRVRCARSTVRSSLSARSRGSWPRPRPSYGRRSARR